MTFADSQSASLSRSTPQRICINVLGMHRSGTSALARVISLLGADLPNHLLAARVGNEAGHWEPSQIVVQNERALNLWNSHWCDWRPLDPEALSPAQRADLIAATKVAIESEFAGKALFVLKDPRVCRLMPFFAEAMTQLAIEMRHVLSVRNPIEVAGSLASRDGIDRKFAVLVWLAHVLASERATRGQERTIVFYDDLMADWRREAQRMATVLPAEMLHPNARAQADIDSFLKKDLRHHATNAADLQQDPCISNWARQTYRALLNLKDDPTNDEALAQLDHIGSAFHKAADAFDGTASELARLSATVQRLTLPRRKRLERAVKARLFGKR